ncbi:hypothetical protein [Paraburkholderia hospita]|uniref:DUF7940 domain-containing protein n=1 Tax=Paraburkholderia hospita TaxID=169430 RepID=UPI0008A7763A|nr:hypothetical protein [Paraburkholderia hospita]SEH89998.1 hypothetical protein SAMN05192544_1011164 [Paraburkholderia hospita]
MNLIERIKAILIDDIDRAHKFIVTWIAAGLGCAATAYELLPTVRDYLDPAWVKWIALAILVARVVKQGGAKNAN